MPVRPGQENPRQHPALLPDEFAQICAIRSWLPVKTPNRRISPAIRSTAPGVNIVMHMQNLGPVWHVIVFSPLRKIGRFVRKNLVQLFKRDPAFAKKKDFRYPLPFFTPFFCLCYGRQRNESIPSMPLEFQGLYTSLRIESGYMLCGNVALRSAFKFCLNVMYVLSLCSMMFIISFSLNC